jgi:WD40 repeat protein
MYQEIYHLYHHQPDPLELTALNDQAWLVNNSISYSIVATIKAATPEHAYAGLLAKMQEQSLRAVEITMGNILRETLPGDVLVGAEKAWMLLPDGQLRLLPYEPSPSWKFFSHDTAVEGLSWSPTGEHLVAASRDVLLHTLSGNDERRSSATSYLRHRNHTVCAVAWSPDGTHIASGGYDAEVHIWKPHPEGGYGKAARGSLLICQTQETRSSFASRITCLAWAPDSRTLLAGRSRGDIVQWDTLTGECLRIFQRHQGVITTLVYSPDGTRIASTGENGSLRMGSLEEPDQDLVCQQTGTIPTCAWSPDGSLVVSSCQGEQSLQCWDAWSGAPCERIPLSVSSTKQLSIQTIAWSPDGRMLAAGCDDSTLQMIDMHLRRHTLTYRTGHAMINDVAWSPDGHYIVCGLGSPDGVQIWQFGSDMSLHLRERS